MPETGAPTIYRLRRTVLAAGRIYEEGFAGPPEAFGEHFHPLRVAGHLEEVSSVMHLAPNRSSPSIHA